MDDRTYVAYESDTGDGIMHYGVLGMKWGIRRYENKNGTLTEKGKKHYAETGEKGYRYHSHSTKKYAKKAAKARARAEKATDENVKAKLLRKAEKYESRHKASDRLDRKEEQYARRVSAAGNIAARALTLGIVGGKSYQQRLAMMNGQNEKGVTSKKIGAAALSGLLEPVEGASVGGRVQKALYLRRQEKADAERKKKKQS